MSWTSIHFAVGMACGGAMAGTGCMVLRRGWRWLPAAMTLGGIWANVPDMPRLWRQDFPNLPFAATLGSMELERFLHRMGDVFFFHHWLDIHRGEYALHGLILMILLYNACIVYLMRMEHRQRNSLANRAWRSHEAHVGKPLGLRLTGVSDANLPTPIRGGLREQRSSHLSHTL